MDQKIRHFCGVCHTEIDNDDVKRCTGCKMLINPFSGWRKVDVTRDELYDTMCRKCFKFTGRDESKVCILCGKETSYVFYPNNPNARKHP